MGKGMLRDLQSMLSRINGIEQNLDVYDFLVTDAALLAQLETGETARSTAEKVLIQESPDAVDMTLYLDEELLRRLTSRDPRRRLGRANLADFWIALEGVSHFNYIAWNAASDKSVTLMEVEMQAEVDKYVGARLLSEQQRTSLGDSVFRRLFDEPRFDEQLGPAELSRYRHASRFAGRFCRSLEQRFASGALAPAMLHELRAFYRLPQPEKISHIQVASFA
ncbi:MAG: hypothetical protein ACE5G3_04445 [Gammaproteobacteria bacterium]